ncbi:MAG: hypothetical protein P4L46_25570 [Fimbriimonas sp.]|nr:hypothetical protein [Fimbriimonas sp.]
MPHHLGLREVGAELYVKNLASLGRLLSFRAKPFHDVDARAGRYLKRLETPDNTLRFRLLLETLRLQFDLLDEASALEPLSCKLQARIIELAPQFKTAKQMADRMLTETPIGVLFFGIVCQAYKSGSTCVRFEFPRNVAEAHRAQVLTVDGWVDAVSMPPDVGGPLRGYAARVEAIGYDTVREYITFRGSIPDKIAFHWLDSVTLDLDVH